jgi:hypothetical protein
MKEKILFKASGKHGNAAVGYVRSKYTIFGIYAEQFSKAALTLAKKIANSPGFNDIDACPIVFLYRHAVELNLKQIIIIGRDLCSLNDKNLSLKIDTHSLSKLLAKAREVFKEIGLEWPNTLTDDVPYSIDQAVFDQVFNNCQCFHSNLF